MIIQIAHSDAMDICVDAYEYKGAKIVDYDEGAMWLQVSQDEIDIDCTWWQVKEPHEFWGQKGYESFTEYDIKSCTWEGHAIENEEEVFEKMELDNV